MFNCSSHSDCWRCPQLHKNSSKWDVKLLLKPDHLRVTVAKPQGLTEPWNEVREGRAYQWRQWLSSRGSRQLFTTNTHAPNGMQPFCLSFSFLLASAAAFQLVPFKMERLSLSSCLLCAAGAA